MMARLARLACAVVLLLLGPALAARAATQDGPVPPEVEASTLSATVATRTAEMRIEQVRANAAVVREVLDIGLTGSDAGDLLREARQRAPETPVLVERVAARERELAEARLDRVRLLERRRLSQDPDEAIQLAAALSAHATYVTALETVLAAERELLTEATRLINLLDSRMLWVASAPAVGRRWLADVAAGAVWLTSPAAWSDVGQTLLRRMNDVPMLTAAYVLTVALLMAYRRRLCSTLPRLAAAIDRPRNGFVVTAQALLVTLLLTATTPVGLGGAAVLLLTGPPDPFARAIGNGLLAAATVYLLLEAFRQTCRRSGLADAHFAWNERARRVLRAELWWLLIVEVAAAFVVSACDASDNPVYRLGLGRLSFMVGALGMTLFMVRVFHPTRGVPADFLSHTRWTWRFRHLWYGLLVILPAGQVVAAAAGYYFTAMAVQSRFFSTGLVVLAGMVGYSLLTRWLLVARRRLAMTQARQRFADQHDGKQRQEATGDAVPELTTPGVDASAASEQTLSLLRTLVALGVLASLWAVWVDVLPALAVLEQIALTNPTVDAAGEVLVDAVTAWSLLVAVLTLVLTVVAARSVPALLELIVLERVRLDAGARYAAGTLTRYVVVATGVIVASGLLGIDWSRAQWIIAALGVGLGFGLQEIVANFVSGLIILFERPVRLGDIVTVGEDSGTVSRLQIRATTITDWDNKEILIPNKNFITERVVNWSLTNAVTRLLVRVGVAYGTDEPAARAAIADAVARIPAVLDQPPPSVFFVGFGESSLDFEVRAFVGDLSTRLTTLHEIHSAINAALADAGIEIPFPQRDLHLRTSDLPLVARSGPA